MGVSTHQPNAPMPRSGLVLSAYSVEKLTFASAEIAVPNATQAPFLSGFARLLRCRKDLGQFPEVLGGGGEEEFVICAAGTTKSQPFEANDPLMMCEEHLDQLS